MEQVSFHFIARIAPTLGLTASLLLPAAAVAQGSASLGNGLSAAAIARGGTIAAQQGDALDAVEGNPAGLAAISAPTLDLSAVGLYVGGSFQNSVNANAKPRGVGGALPYGAYAMPIGHTRWVASAAFTPEILMRADWHYADAPGTFGVTYGYQTQETQIIAVRSSLGVARPLGKKWSLGATLGIVFNQNDLHAPYIFQQQPQLAGMKVLLNLTTRGYGWNGGAGVQYQPTSRLRTGLAWKSGTTIRTNGTASGSASALFNTLGITASPAYSYQAQVMNHLPQAFDAGFTWQPNRRITVSAEGDMTVWAQAFHVLPISLTGGTNATIDSVVGANSCKDAVLLDWNNQGTFHGGIETPAGESVTLRAGYSYSSNPVPNANLTPLTAAIMQNAIGTGAGWHHGRWVYDAAYQAQLPATQSVGLSGLRAGEYSNSRVRVWTQSLTVSAHVKF